VPEGEAEQMFGMSGLHRGGAEPLEEFLQQRKGGGGLWRALSLCGFTLVLPGFGL